MNNLATTTKFYTDLGFTPKGENTSKELMSFFFGKIDFVIHFFLKKILNNNIKSEIADSIKVTKIQFTLSASNKKELDNWEKEVEKAGRVLFSKEKEFGKSYYSFDFADPDPHRFNLFYMERL